jgi:hypothetical protein
VTTPTIELPAVDGFTVHGWLVALGAARVLGVCWPDMRMRWREPAGAEPYCAAVYPVFTDGPANVEEAAEVILATTVDAIQAGGVLPGLDPAYPPAGRDWYGPDHDHPQTGDWTGEDGPVWQSCLITPLGALHPLLRPHAAQTVRGMLAKPAQVLAADRTLMRAALVGLGLDDRYPGGLWLLRHTVTAADSSSGQPGGRASAGRDWLAIMALPWMPVTDEVHPEYGRGGPAWRISAVGWRQRVMDWRLWPQDLPVSSVPTILGHGREPSGAAWLPVPDGGGWRGVARRPVPSGRHDPPYMRSYTRAEVAALERGGAL